MPVSNNFTILYASQTGQAKAIAEEIHERSSENGLQSKLFCLSLTEKKFRLEKEPVVVFVVSTTGEGDPPDTMHKFFRRLKKKTLPADHLQSTKYALLALGDTNYTNFCVNGKNLARRLHDLGAQKFYDTGHADDAVGLEIVVEPWIDGLWDAVKKCLGLSQGEPIKDKVVVKPVIQELGDKRVQNGIDSIANGDTSSNDFIVNNGNKREEETAKGSNQVSSSIVDSNKSDAKVNGVIAEECKPSLRQSIAPLSTSSLSVPTLPPPFLEVNFQPDQTIDCTKIPLQGGASFPGAASAVSMATLVSVQQLTSSDAVKTALDVELDISECGFEYEAGDSFNVYCPNDKAEVDELIDTLGLTSVADVPFQMKVLESTKKKVAVKPSYVPKPCTIRHALVTCLEIRSVPKKALLRALVEHTSDPVQKRRLQELCSKQGSDDYHKYVREPSLSLLELLKAFPSCKPPFQKLLEHLPRLNPRPYSVASSPLTKPGHLNFVFNVVEFPEYDDLRIKRQGICTGWLNKLTEFMRFERDEISEELPENLSKMKLDNSEIKVAVSARNNTDFKLPHDHRVPIIMIGPGTGVAPFIGFLEHREKEQALGDGDANSYGQTWLFFGCRNKEKDFLYQEKLNTFVSNGTLTRLSTSFSRDGDSSPRYVQDNLKCHGNEVADLVLNGGAVVYVCGDAKHMARNVFDCFCQIIEEFLHVSKMDAIKEMARLRKERKYREDIWT